MTDDNDVEKKELPCIVCQLCPVVDDAAKRPDRPTEFSDMTHTELGFVAAMATTLVSVAQDRIQPTCDRHMNAVAMAILAAVADLPKPEAKRIVKKYGLPEAWVR
jgi:hypothetical protein